MSHYLKLAALVIALKFPVVQAADYYVATSGNDSASGSISDPFRTIQRAANAAVAGDNVIIRAGVYHETVRPANSGTSVARITYKAYEVGGMYEDVVISGADAITGWTAHDISGGRAIYKTTAMNWNLSDTGASFGTAYRNQIFVNGQMIGLARWPNAPAERLTRLTYQDLALVTAGSGSGGSTANSAWIENANIAATFPAGYWSDPARATARVFLSPATMIWGMSVKIASQSANRLNLDATGTGFDFTGGYYYPTANNRFFIYDYYDALDSPGEFWKDTATNTLYLWAPAGANPATLTVEARRRDFGLSLGSRSFLTFRGIKLFGCTMESDGASNSLVFQEIEARYFAHIDNYAPTFSTSPAAREFYLRGDGHVVQDSYFSGSAVTAIGASGTNMRIENNVIRDFGYAHHGPAILARNGGIHGNRILATKNQFLRNTAFNGGHTIVVTDPALDIKYNRIYNSHLRGSDVGAVGIASTDGLGSEIAYNVISDALGPKDSGVLYGGFGIYFDYECRNYTVHHNIVWGTTASSYQLMPNRAAYLSGVTDMGMKFYNNTGDGDFGLIAPQDIPGVDVRNNLVRKFLNASNGTYTGLPNVQFSNNTSYNNDGAAPFRNRSAHDLRFATGSSTGVNAGTVISPYTDGFVGAAPDTGALEFDVAPFIAGATLVQRQLSALTLSNSAQTGSLVDLEIGNLPEGRSPTSGFQAQIGSEAFGGTLAYDHSSSTWRILGVNKGVLTGLQSISVRLSGSSTAVTLDSPVDVGGGLPAPEIALRGNGTNIVDGDTTPSGTDHTVFNDVQVGDPSGTSQTYTIYNFGSLDLTLGAITLSGAHAADFSVITSPIAVVAPGASTDFTLRFIPSALGLRSATVRIASDDLDEADFDFAVQGQGSTPQPELNLPSPQLAAVLAPASTGSVVLPIQNTGLANLTWSLASSTGTGLYSWADSASGGPAYSWYDIKTLGTRVWGGEGTNTDDAYSTINLPFTFPFYGSNYTQLTLDTNGVVYPGIRTAYAFNNQALPNSVVGSPAALIAGFWDDLFVDPLAQVRYHTIDATTFVILYENVKSFGSSNRITFQIVLRTDGQITVQYQDNQFTRSYTIGLQNPARTLGPQVAYSGDSGTIQGLQLPVGTGIHRAISFYPPANFVTGFTPASGSVAPGIIASPLVNLSSAGLAAGTYQTTLTLTSNDADEASTQIPVSLQVATPAAPVITASQSATGTSGVAFNYQIAASNTPDSYTLTGGSLPTGVTLNTTTGLLSGISGSTGVFTPVFTATNALGTSPPVSISVTITSQAAPVIAPGQSAAGNTGTAFSYQITASNTPASYALASGSLPSGVTLNTTTGLLSGTPTSPGTFTPAFTATNAGGTNPAVSVTIAIASSALIIAEPFAYPVGTNSPDPDAGLNSGNGLPNTNTGGSPTGISTGLRGNWSTTLDVANGLSYSQNGNTLHTSGGAGAPNNATWGGSPATYRNMATDPFITQRIGASSGGNFGLDGTSLYFSLLAKTTSATQSSFRINFGGSGRNVFLENTATGWSLDENAAGPVPSTATLDLNTSTLLVVKISFVAGAGDTFSLWVNPTLDSPLGTANATLITSLDFGGLANINPRPSVLNAMVFDEFRMGTTYAAVTPYTPAIILDGLQTFRSSNGLAANGSQDLLTPAGDGVPNLLKFAFNMIGTDPGQAATLATPNSSMLSPTGTAGMPFAAAEAITGKLQLTYIRRKTTSAPGITYAVEFSDTLASWAVNASATENSTSLDATFERVTVTDSIISPTRRFVRVRVITQGS